MVLEHLTKLEASPSFEPRRGWRETVRRARADIKDLLDDSPSLRRAVGTIMARQIQDVREAVAETLADYGETPRVALEGLSHDAEAVLGGFFPAEPTASA